MRIGAFELDEPLPELREPHVIATLRPWIDVGSVGALVLSWLEAHFDAEDLGRLARPGNFFDFTRYRPNIYMKDGQRQVNIPNTSVTYGKQDTGNDLIFLHLLEPHNHSEDYVESVQQLLEKFDVKRYTLLGSMYDYTPHTRPMSVSGRSQGSKSPKGLEHLELKQSNYQGPTTITSLIGHQAAATGVETMTFIVHLPQYTQLEEDYLGTVPIMEIISPLYSVPVDQSFIAKAEKQRRQVDGALEKNPQLKTIVEQLESHYDARAARKKEEEMPQLSPEVETFLAEMDRRFSEE